MRPQITMTQITEVYFFPIEYSEFGTVALESRHLNVNSEFPIRKFD
jgi:hypothetical protein